MMNWFRRGEKPVTQACLTCGKRFLLDQLVWINHCYHPESDYLHRHCAGFRLLCSPCHAVASDEFYLGHMNELAWEQPDQYPWDECAIGLGNYLRDLRECVAASGVDPADEEAIRIHWKSKFKASPKAKGVRMTTRVR